MQYEHFKLQRPLLVTKKTLRSDLFSYLLEKYPSRKWIKGGEKLILGSLRMVQRSLNCRNFSRFRMALVLKILFNILDFIHKTRNFCLQSKQAKNR
jgi:hypothetical protein